VNAHESVTVYYPWHALHGQTLTVFRREKQDRRELLFCELANGRLVGIPQWMTDRGCAAYSLGPPVIGVEALVALRELLAAVRRGVADNRPFQEEGHETIRTTSGLAVESASGRYARSADSTATGTGAGPDGTAGPDGSPGNHDAAPFPTGGSP